MTQRPSDHPTTLDPVPTGPVFPGVRLLVATYEADTEQVAPLLPAGVTPWDDPVRCGVWGLDFPFPGVCYRLAGVSVRAAFGGERQNFFPMSYCNRAEHEFARVGAGGRRRTSVIGFSGGGEQKILTVSGVLGEQMITVTATPQRPADLSEIAGPLLQLRGDPDTPRRGLAGPYRLVQTDVQLIGHDVSAGPGLVTMDLLAEFDPLLPLAPVHMLDCYYGVVEMRYHPERTLLRVGGGSGEAQRSW